MKKLSIYLTLFIGLSMLVSCGSGDSKPQPPQQDTHLVTESEFINALSFKEVQYAQRSLTSINNTIKNEQKCLCSPTVSSSIVKKYNSGALVIYDERIVTPIPGSTNAWYEYQRTKEDGIFTVNNSKNPDDFLIPEKDFNWLPLLKNYQLDKFELYTYDNNKNTYSATHTFSNYSVTFTMLFNDKKIIKLNEVETGARNSTYEYVYSYETTTPDLPTYASNLVPKEEFESSLKLTNIQYVQMTQVDQSTTTIDTATVKCSPTVSYEVRETSDTFFEQYVEPNPGAIGSWLCKYRTDRKASFDSKTSTDESDFIKPSAISCYDSLNEMGFGSIDKYQFNTTECTYDAKTTISFTTYELSLKFVNAKIETVKMNAFDGTGARFLTRTLTYKYETITPVFPE